MATGYRYSLALVKAVITIPGYNPKSFGGQGSMIGSVTVSRKNDRFSAEGDATGGYVINETLDSTGTCVISIKQFAPLVSTLTNLFNRYDNGYSGSLEEVADSTNFVAEETLNQSATIQLYYMGNLVANCEGCYLNMAELPMEEENGSRDFTFECGSVKFETLDNRQAFEKTNA